MTSLERKEYRYQRRKAKREKKKEEFLKSLPNYNEIFSFENLWDSFWLCRKEVSWKPSLQIYQQNLSSEIVKLREILFSEEGFKTDGFIEFNICERGKMRHIKSVNIKERVVQKCFCDYYLVPLLTHNLIYDNGASLKNKGIDFTLKRLQLHLKNFYKKYKNNKGYILLYDFSNFFGNINHNILYRMIDPLILDDRSRKLFHHLVDAFGDVGLGLGSQISQVSAIAFPNKIDHYFENCPYVEDYARYMDDGYMIIKEKKNINNCLKILFEKANELKIIINFKKIKILKLSKVFTFLKKHFYLSNSGQCIIKLKRKSIFQYRKKIIKLIPMVNKKLLKWEDLINSHKSWLGQIKVYKNWKSINNIDLQIRRILKDGYNNTDISSNKCYIATS